MVLKSPDYASKSQVENERYICWPHSVLDPDPVPWRFKEVKAVVTLLGTFW